MRVRQADAVLHEGSIVSGGTPLHSTAQRKQTPAVAAAYAGSSRRAITCCMRMQPAAQRSRQQHSSGRSRRRTCASIKSAYVVTPRAVRLVERNDAHSRPSRRGSASLTRWHRSVSHRSLPGLHLHTGSHVRDLSEFRTMRRVLQGCWRRAAQRRVAAFIQTRSHMLQSKSRQGRSTR